MRKVRMGQGRRGGKAGKGQRLKRRADKEIAGPNIAAGPAIFRGLIVVTLRRTPWQSILCDPRTAHA